jgi:MFS family permease
MSFQKNIKLLTWFNFFTDFKLYGPIAIIYFSRVSHSYALGASIFSIIYIVSAIFDVPTGIFADRVGRKKTVILGALFSVIAVLFYAIGGVYWLLAIGAFSEGLSRAFYSGNNNALLHNMLSEEGLEHDYHEYLGKLSAMFQVALGIAGLLGALIANWSFPIIMWLSVIPQFICLFISFQITDGNKVANKVGNIITDLKEGIGVFIHNANLRLLSITDIIDYSLGESSYQFQSAFFNTLIPIWAVGIARALQNIGAAIGFHFSGKIINKFKAVPVLFFGEIFSKLTTFTALIFPTAFSPFLMSTNSFLYGTASTATGSLMQKEFTDKQRATMSSLNSFAGSLFFGVLAFVTGLFADKLGPRNALLILQILSLVVLGLLWKLYRINRTKSSPKGF